MATLRSIGLIAGGGELPLHFAKKAKAMGYSVHTAAVLGSASKAIEKHSDSVEWVSIGQVGKLISHFKKQKVSQAVMHGKVEHATLFKNLKLDLKAISLWVRLKDRSGEGLLKALADELKKQGVLLKDCRFLMDELLTPKGLLIGWVGGDKSSVDYGIRQAKLISGAGIGQTLVVKKKAVVAVEAMEGTDKTIQRAGELAGSGTIVIKVTSPTQDWRFDVPTVGPKTVQKLIGAKAKGLVLEAGKSFLLQPEKVAAQAKKHGFFIRSI